MILDGELVAFDESGKPSFNALQNRFQLKTARDIAAAEKNTPVVFYAFDLPYFAGVDLRRAPYADRRRYLAQCLLPSPLVQLVHASEDGIELYRAALANGFEGVIGKRRQSKYESGKRSASWIKVKSTQSAEFVVGGYTTGKGARAPLGALLIGYWQDKKLRYASHVGSGFDEQSLASMRARLEPLQRKTCPFADKPELNAPTTWVEPQAVVEVKFQGWTDDGSLRAPVFLRLRDDIDAKAVKRSPQGAAAVQPASSAGTEIDQVLSQLEKCKTNGTIAVGAHGIKLSNLDRIYWPADPALKQPALTKRDLLRYLAQVSPLHAAAPGRPPAHHDPHARRHQRPALLSEALDAGAAQVRRDHHRVLGAQGRAPRLPAVQQPADVAVARAIGNARVPRLALARAAGIRCQHEGNRLCVVPRRVGRLGLELSRLRGVRHRSVHLLRQGSAGRRARAQHGRVREGQGSRVSAARAAEQHGARSDRQDFRQDRAARVPADPAHDRLRCRARGVARRSAAT